MAAVFDAPVATVGEKDTFRIGLFRSSAGNAICDFTGVFTGFFICGFSLDDKGLSDVRKVQIAVEIGCGPNFTDFDTAVIRRVIVDKIGVSPVIKIERNVLKKTGLIVFDSKMVMGLTFFDQIIGNATLGQKGVGGNIFALDIDGVKQWDGGLDFVGALDLLVGYGQGAYFFWV